MDNDTASPRAGAGRLRTVCLRTSILLGALISMTFAPAIAAAGARRHLGHARRDASSTRPAPPRRAFARRQVLTIRVRRAAHHSRTARRHHSRTARRHHSRTARRHHRRRVPSTAGRRGCLGAHARVGAARHTDIQRAVVCLLNAQRRRHRLPPLRANTRLDDSAQSWTNTMVRDRAFSHGTDFAARITAVGFDWTQVGENIAAGYRSPASVVSAWMASTGHCQNILSPNFREVGTGVVVSSVSPEARGTWTLDLGLLAGQHGSDNWAPAEGCPYPAARR